jgi:hypothetical protein
MSYFEQVSTLPPAFSRWFTPAVLVLFNLIPLAGVFLWAWDAGAIVMLYWAENLIIGAMTLIRMLRKSPLRGLFDSLFFSVHYGGFCAAHGMLAGALFGWPTEAAMDDLSWPFIFVFVEMLYRVIGVVFSTAPQAWIWAFWGVALSHTISFIYHDLMRGEGNDKSRRDIMFSPYPRIIVLHIAVILGGILVQSMGTPVWLLVVLIALKIGLDVGLHRRQHKL